MFLSKLQESLLACDAVCLRVCSVWVQACDEEKLLGHLGVVLYEYLGEEYPEVLGSILGALKSIVNVIGMTKMTPPIKDLLPRLTPILKNRHEKVRGVTVLMPYLCHRLCPDWLPRGLGCSSVSLGAGQCASTRLWRCLPWSERRQGGSLVCQAGYHSGTCECIDVSV